jgi:hypothetical protein
MAKLSGAAAVCSVRSSAWLAGTFKALGEDDAVDPGTPIVLHDRYPLGIWHALAWKDQSLMQPNRADHPFIHAG